MGCAKLGNSCRMSKHRQAVLCYADAEGDSEKRPPWDVFRAVRTAAFYDAIPNPLNMLSSASTQKTGSGEMLWGMCTCGTHRYVDNPMNLEWGVLDDVVMGGASKSDFFGNTWTGTIVTAGGGFAGIRTKAIRPALDVSQCKGIRLRVKGGDGQRFKLILRDTYDWNGIAWSYEFDTKTFMPSLDGIIEVSATFSDLVPTLFARRLQNEQFNTGQLTALQITLSKFGYDDALNPNFKPGEFSLQIESISTF